MLSPSDVGDFLCFEPTEQGIELDGLVLVIGVPHEKWGEAVKAIVTLHQGKTVTDKELVDLCRGKIAGYKIPKSVDIIKSGGYKISALEIEEALRLHPEVRDCGVVGTENEEWGEIVAAVISAGREHPALYPIVGYFINPVLSVLLGVIFLRRAPAPGSVDGRWVDNDWRCVYHHLIWPLAVDITEPCFNLRLIWTG
jgi:hypothetical protein